LGFDGQANAAICVCGVADGAKVRGTIVGVKPALTVTDDEFTDTEHAPVPEHAPVQPANSEFVPGVSVRFTVVIEPKVAEQVPLTTPSVSMQSIPPTSLVTVPEAVPFSVTVSVKVGGGLTVSVVLESLALVKLVSPA